LPPNPPEICVALVNDDPPAIDAVAPLADMFEVRIDLIGSGWRQVVGLLKKPWIACARLKEEGGKWNGSEAERIKQLRDAVDLGASIIDIELATPGLTDFVKDIKGKAQGIISYHNLKATPSLDALQQIIVSQLAAGADICKVVTTARTFADNLTVLKLVSEFSPKHKIISFAMGEKGQLSRILCPLVGGHFTYASVGEGKESAEGQLTVKNLMEIYKILGVKS
jgi:3-dehydroquinate dehydratase-1